ncbi:MAG: hypothetical protein WCF85_22170, partial [Rhodospirillaceae bacterium]
MRSMIVASMLALAAVPALADEAKPPAAPMIATSGVGGPGSTAAPPAGMSPEITPPPSLAAPAASPANMSPGPLPPSTETTPPSAATGEHDPAAPNAAEAAKKTDDRVIRTHVQVISMDGVAEWFNSFTALSEGRSIKGVTGAAIAPEAGTTPLLKAEATREQIVGLLDRASISHRGVDLVSFDFTSPVGKWSSDSAIMEGVDGQPAATIGATVAASSDGPDIALAHT